MSFSKLIPSLLVTALAVGVTTTAAEAKPAAAKAKPIQSRIVVEDVQLAEEPTDVDGDGVLSYGTVTGTIAGLPFTTQITEFAIDAKPTEEGVCSILHLELAPIDINLLGLHVDTSAICLELTAMEGDGILGDLLCALAGDATLLDDVLGVLPDVLNESLAKAQPPQPAQPEPADICDGDCEILDLAIGPVELDLLGLMVDLDNCAGGPVQVCVSATEGAGLLGDLLCGLAGGGIIPDLGNLEDLIGGILDDLNVDLTDRQLDRLVKQVRRLLRDGNLSVHDIEQLARFVERLVQPA